MPSDNAKTKNIALIAAIIVFIILIGAAIYGGIHTVSSWANVTDDITTERNESGKQDPVPTQDEIVNDNDMNGDDTQQENNDQQEQGDDNPSQDPTTEEPSATMPEQAQQPSPDNNTQQPQQSQQPQQQIAPNPAPAANNGGGGGSNTSGAYYAYPSSVSVPSFNDSAAAWGSGCGIDFSNTGQGYIGIRASSRGNLKAQVSANGMSYNYVLPNNNTPIYVPLNMGSGTYQVRVMVNTSGNRYAQVFEHSQNASTNGIQPYLVPNQFVWYTNSSACVGQARALANGCSNQGEIVRNIYTWLSQNIRYDNGKAANAANMTDYIPNPDSTLSSRSGICFDYASLAAAMFRSLGIPCKVMTGNVSPNNVYHSWNMVYINGSWQGVGIYVSPNTWTRMDITFAAGGATDFSGFHYADRYTY